jgi:predicted AlkP superfamily phosphohydrolase/phosphomutase
MDGLTPQLLFRWAENGDLPNFQKMMKNSSYGKLQSTLPPYSSQAWTSCATGVNPGKHGIHGFMDLEGPVPDDPESDPLRFHSSMSNHAATLWEILGSVGKRSISINIPLTSPAYEIEGIMISGFPHPSTAPFVFPRTLENEIAEYRPDVYGEKIGRGEENKFINDMYDISRRRLNVTKKLFGKKDWDLLFVVFTIPDRVQHYFWKFMDQSHPHYNIALGKKYGGEVKKIYHWMDRVVEEFVELLDNDTYLIVLSDHGFRPVRIQVNGEVFLREVNADSLFQVYATENFGATFKIKPRHPEAITGDIEAQKRQFVERFVKQLTDLEDPQTGEKIIKQVYRKEDIYSGPHLAGAPDVVALESEGYLFLNWVKREGSPVVQHVPVRSFFSGHHQVDGIIFISGEGIKKAHEIQEAEIIDIAPTILSMLGLPVGSDMDGRPITDSFDSDFLRENAEKERFAYNIDVAARKYLYGLMDRQSTEIEDQLKSIGYVE